MRETKRHNLSNQRNKGERGDKRHGQVPAMLQALVPFFYISHSMPPDAVFLLLPSIPGAKREDYLKRLAPVRSQKQTEKRKTKYAMVAIIFHESS